MNVFVICICSDECIKVYGNVSNSILLHLIRIWVFHARLVRVSQLIEGSFCQSGAETCKCEKWTSSVANRSHLATAPPSGRVNLCPRLGYGNVPDSFLVNLSKRLLRTDRSEAFH